MVQLVIDLLPAFIKNYFLEVSSGHKGLQRIKIEIKNNNTPKINDFPFSNSSEPDTELLTLGWLSQLEKTGALTKLSHTTSVVLAIQRSVRGISRFSNLPRGFAVALDALRGWRNAQRLKDYISQKSARRAPRDRPPERARPFGPQRRSLPLPSSLPASRPPHGRGRGGSRAGVEPELKPEPQRRGIMKA